jgi:hypothetical protein
MPEGTRLADPPADREVRRLRSAIGAYKRHGNDQAEAETRRALEWRQLENHVRRFVGEFKPLTDAELELAAWAADHAARAPRISAVDAAPLVAIFRGAEAVNPRASG